MDLWFVGKENVCVFFTRELNYAMENFILLLAATEVVFFFFFFSVMLDINHIFCM